MSTLSVIAAAALGWLVLVGATRLVARPLRRGPGGDALSGIMWRVLRGYCRLVHRPTWAGLDLVPDTNRPGGLVVVSNHTSPVDPLLIQAACRFEIRWMMAADLMLPQLAWLWRRQRLIAVARDGSDIGPAREAIRHVRAGGVIGIFPEGRIVRPAGHVRPFHEGVGLIIARSGAPVLLVWVQGTPAPTDITGALFTRSRARVQFVERLEFHEKCDPRAITDDLRRRLARAAGWALCDEPPPPAQQPGPDPFAL